MPLNPAHFRYAQLGLAALCFCLAVAVLGTAADTISVYHSEITSNPWWLPLWTEHFDTHGTSGLIASAVTVILFIGFYLVIMLTPKFSLGPRPTWRLLLTLSTTLPAALATLCTTVYAAILNRNAPATDTIQTWTCRFRHSAPSVAGAAVPLNQSNDNFARLCAESKFALYATLTVFLLLCVGVVTAVVGWVVELVAERRRRKAEKGEWVDGGAVEMVVPKA